MFFSGGISLPFLASLSYLFIISYSWSHVCKIVFDRHFVFVREWGKWQGGAHLRCHFTVLHTGADNHVLLVKPERRVGMCLSQEEREAPQSQGCLSTHGRKVFQGGCKDRMLCFGMGRVYSFYLYRESDCDKTFFLCWANVLSDQRHILTHTHTQSHVGLFLLFFCHRSCLTLWPHGLQHDRLPSSSPSPGACSNSCPSSRWSHPTLSSSVVPFSSCLQSCPTSGSFPMSQLFTSGGQSIGASASASILPMNIQGWFPLGLTVLISLPSKGLSRVFSNTTVQKHQLFNAQPSLQSNSHIHTWLLEKL